MIKFSLAAFTLLISIGAVSFIKGVPLNWFFDPVSIAVTAFCVTMPVLQMNARARTLMFAGRRPDFVRTWGYSFVFAAVINQVHVIMTSLNNLNGGVSTLFAKSLLAAAFPAALFAVTLFSIGAPRQPMRNSNLDKNNSENQTSEKEWRRAA